MGFCSCDSGKKKILLLWRSAPCLSGLLSGRKWNEHKIIRLFPSGLISLSQLTFVRSWAVIIRYVNADRYWMSGLVLSFQSVHFPYHFFVTWRKGKNKTNVLEEMLCFWSVSQVAYSSEENKHYYRWWNESVEKLEASWVSDRRYLCSSIKGWAVIRAHFNLNECKLAHLLWWSSCPDSSISMIDQLSSCPLEMEAWERAEWGLEKWI